MKNPNIEYVQDFNEHDYVQILIDYAADKFCIDKNIILLMQGDKVI